MLLLIPSGTIHRLLFTFLSFCLCESAALSQDYIYNHYNTENGLAGSTVHSMYQDREGFMWFATQTGVSRFDGTTFKSYTTMDGLADNEVYRIYSDKKGRIWFTGYNAELCYYYKGKIYNSSTDSSLKGTVRYMVHDFVEQGDTLYLAGGNVYKIHNRVIPFTSPDYHNTLAILPGRNGSVSYANYYGIIFRNEGGKTRIIGKVPRPQIIHKGAFKYRDYLLLFTGKDIVCMKTGKDTSTFVGRYAFPSDIVRLNTDRDNNLWVSTISGGTYCYTSFPSPKMPSPLLKGMYITQVFEDNERNLWFSTVGNGLYLLTSRNACTYNIQNNLSSNQANTITGDHKGNIYIGFNKGRINRISASGIREYITIDAAYNRIIKLDPDTKGNIWCASDYGLYKIDSSDHLSSFIPRRAIKAIKEISSNRLLFCYSDTVYECDMEHPSSIRPFWGKRVNTICPDTKGNIWLGTQDGVYKYDGHSFFHLGKPGSRETMFSKKTISILKDSQGALWFATEGNGITYMDDHSIHILSQSDGLTSNICKSIFLDKDDNLWIATNRGLNKITIYDRKKFRYIIQKYNSLDGLASDEINDVFTEKNRVWVATNNGITSFDETRLHNAPPPPAYITDVKVGSSSVPANSFLVLPYNRNNLRFSFVGISFFSAGRMRYKYFLKGIDSRWQYTTQNTVEYGALPAGNYEFIVFAQDSKGVQSPQPAYFEFEITPAFWHTQWFQACMLILILAALVMLGYFRIWRIKTREQAKTSLAVKIAQLELQAVRAQINPHFIFNCLNSIQHYIIRHDHISAQRYLSSFAKLIRKTLDFSKSIYIPLSEEIEYLETYLRLETMRFESKFSHQVTVGKNISPAEITMPAMLLQPHVENAVVHAFPASMQKEGILSISFEKEKGLLICRIEDNGVGRSPKSRRKHTSHGMNMTSGRIDSLNTIFNNNEALITQEIIDKFDEQSGSSGTVVIIKIPIVYDKSSNN